jgi:hypothetical protein
MLSEDFPGMAKRKGEKIRNHLEKDAAKYPAVVKGKKVRERDNEREK